MPLVKRLVKGSPLTYAEADGNLTYLDNKVTGSVGLIPVFDSVNTVTGSDVISQLGNNIIVDGGLTIYGDLTARQYIVSSSVSHFTESFSSGSTRFGDTITDTHQFTGSVSITGSLHITGSQNITGFISSSDGAYFSNAITVTHMTIGHGPTENNTNTAIGWTTMPVLVSGLRNTVVGAGSGFSLQSGSDNTIFGNNAMLVLTSGSYNTAIGQNAGALASGSGNVFLGHQAGAQQILGDNKLWIANSGTLTPLIKGDFASGSLQFNTAAGTQVTGSFLVTGSSVFSGSATGIVNTLSISSNTASLDLSKGNFFTLQLVGGADTYINPSNIKSGQTVNILINTTGSATVSFPSSVLQASGSTYVPTTTVGKDIITLISFDTINLYLANVKNLV